VFTLPDSWTWDFWIADDGERFHLFFLYASRALPHPDDRHRRASVGHAVSTDLRTWERVADALVRSDAPAADDVATWTGSVVRDDDGVWWMFYTGASDDPLPYTQRVLAARSTDLHRWEKVGRVLSEADPRWYETAETLDWRDISWRDPWVQRSADGGWRMLVTEIGRAHV
jgi:beta-fructofuranosidase